MDWQQIVVSIIGSGLGTTGVGLLFKRKFDHELEAQKASLARGSRVHERQVDVLAKLYQHLYEAQSYLQLMASSARFEGEKPEEYPGLFQKAFQSAHDQFLAGRLLISPEIVGSCEALFKKFWEGRSELAFANLPMAIDGNQRAQFWDNAKTIAYKDIPLLLQEIETSARAAIHGE